MFRAKAHLVFHWCLYNKTKYWFIVWKYVFLLHVLNKNENILMLGTLCPKSSVSNEETALSIATSAQIYKFNELFA